MPRIRNTPNAGNRYLESSVAFQTNERNSPNIKRVKIHHLVTRLILELRYEKDKKIRGRYIINGRQTRSHSPRHRYQVMAATTSTHHSTSSATLNSSVRVACGKNWTKYSWMASEPNAAATDASRSVRNLTNACTGVHSSPIPNVIRVVIAKQDVSADADFRRECYAALCATREMACTSLR